jgi:hypothetical protein
MSAFQLDGFPRGEPNDFYGWGCPEVDRLVSILKGIALPAGGTA